MQTYRVVCEWADANGVEDADEVFVRAESATAARAKAKAKWRLTIGTQWPSCSLRRVFTMTSEKFADFE
jgi:hypothetical protein